MFLPLKILVCYHKPACLYRSNLFIPIHVGRALGPTDSGINTAQYQWLLDNMIGDDTEDNISQLNRHFCELTAVYWAWKNYDKLGNPDYIGLSHYRRLFSPEAIKIATRHDITAPFEYISPQETMLQQFIREHHTDDLTAVFELLKKQYPAYASTADRYLSQRGSYFFNMFIMKKELFFEYCSMLFSILLPFHAQMDYTGHTPYNQRMPGFLGERLTSVFITQKKGTGLPVHTCRAVYCDSAMEKFSTRGFWQGLASFLVTWINYIGCRLLSHITDGKTAQQFKVKKQKYKEHIRYMRAWFAYR